MRKRAIVIGLSVAIFVSGIILMGVSMVTKRGLIISKRTLELLKGSEIVDMVLYLPYAGKCGINITGSFQGHEGQPVFFIRDQHGHPLLAGPIFHASSPPSNVIEFDVDEPGIYNIDFNIIVSDDSCVELYQFRGEIEDIQPYAHLFMVGALVGASGLVGCIVGLFVLPKPKD